MKKVLAVVLALAMVFSLAACGETEGETTTPTLKIGAIYINGKNDTAGYTFAHSNGINTAMKELGIDESQLAVIDYVAEDYDAVAQACDTLVAEGCNLIFGISFGYLNAMNDKAAEYPEVAFSHATGYLCNDTNFNNYFGRAYQARYLAGIAAGLKAKEQGSTKVGYVAAYTTEYAETASGINGFALGVQSVLPEAEVYVKKLGTWADEVNEYAYAEELVKTFGCSVISQHCDSAQPQIAAETNGAFSCGYNSDMTADAPAAHLTAAIWNWNIYYKTAIEAAQACFDEAGEFHGSQFVEKMGGSAYYKGLDVNFVDYSPLTENCAAGTQDAIDQVKAMIVSGDWDVFTGTKLNITVDGETATVEKVEADLTDNAGNVVVAAGGASVEDGVITGTMNYLVNGVSEK